MKIFSGDGSDPSFGYVPVFILKVKLSVISLGIQISLRSLYEEYQTEQLTILSETQFIKYDSF